MSSGFCAKLLKKHSVKNKNEIALCMLIELKVIQDFVIGINRFEQGKENEGTVLNQ